MTGNLEEENYWGYAVSFVSSRRTLIAGNISLLNAGNFIFSKTTKTATIKAHYHIFEKVAFFLCANKKGQRKKGFRESIAV